MCNVGASIVAKLSTCSPPSPHQAGRSCRYVLRNLSEQQKCCAYVQILIPPVSSCIKEECNKRKSGSLSAVCQPIAVTLYDVDGGRPAAKILLLKMHNVPHYIIKQHMGVKRWREKHYFFVMNLHAPI